VVKDNEADGSDGTVKSPDYESRPDECVKTREGSFQVVVSEGLLLTDIRQYESRRRSSKPSRSVNHGRRK